MKNDVVSELSDECLTILPVLTVRLAEHLVARTKLLRNEYLAIVID